MNLVQKVKKYIQGLRLLSMGDRVIVGVSGGPDSVALIHFLYLLQHELALQLHIAHFNHALRKGSVVDEKFVKKLAHQLNLPFTTKCWDSSSLTKKGSFEETARNKRLEFLISLAKKKKANVIALGHTKNDLAETVLMRILRGTGLKGLRGILPKREFQNVRVIRPLLGIEKKELEQYLRKNRLSYRIDPSNRQLRFFRNKIRHRLLPYLEKEYNKNIQTILSNFSMLTTIDYDFLERQARSLFNNMAICSKNHSSIKFNIPLFNKQHPALQHYLIRLAIERLSGDTNRLTLCHSDEIEDLIRHRPARSLVHLPKRIHILKDTNKLQIYK